MTFPNIAGGNYTEAPTVPASYVLTNACWSKSLNTPASGTGLSNALSVPTDADTITWNLGYTLGSPWVQTQLGNVYASGNLKSYVPAGVIPRVFNLSGIGGYPGLVNYGTDYDFDPGVGKGETYVSSTNWLSNETRTVVDYYQLFYRRLGAPTTQDSFPDPSAITRAQASSRATPYYINGNMGTSGNWSVGNGESVIFLVNGNLTINGKINITGTGFIAFIVNGNVTVASAVGGLYTSTSPVIEGIYITSPTGTFITGTGAAGTEKLVGKGMFIAGSFLLQRDNGDNNVLAPSELFIYNPELLFSMPDIMKDLSVTWQEVAP